MKKVFTVLAAGAALAGLGALARHFGRIPHTDWAKRIESMPDNAPPKWMFRNITAIRENTDRILELLESSRAEQAPAAPPPPGG